MILGLLRRPNSHYDISFPSIEEESDDSMPLSPNLKPEFRSPRDVTEDVLISAIPPAPFNDSFVFKEGEEFENASELDLKISTEDEPLDIDESEDICLRETCEAVVEPTNLEFDHYILYVEYESFSYGLDESEGLDAADCVQYKSFSFDPVISDLSSRNPSLNF